MSRIAFLRPDVRGCCAAPEFRLLPAMRPRVYRPCVVRVPMPRLTVRDPCRHTAAEALLRPQSDVQTSCRQRAAPAAPPLPRGQRCAPRAWLAVGRSQERMREAGTEGKIKGTARDRLPSPSARGLGTAPRVGCAVPSPGWMRLWARSVRVPSPIRCVALRWSLCHGRA